MSVEKIIDCVDQKDFVEAKDSIETVIAQKISVKLQEQKESVASQIFEAAGTRVLQTLRRIVDESQAMRVNFDDGSKKVDAYSASAVVQLYDAVNEKNKQALLNAINKKSGFSKALDFALKRMREQNESEDYDSIFLEELQTEETVKKFKTGKGNRLQAEIKKSGARYEAFVDGEKLDTFKSEKDAEKGIKDFVKVMDV